MSTTTTATVQQHQHSSCNLSTIALHHPNHHSASVVAAATTAAAAVALIAVDPMHHGCHAGPALGATLPSVKPEILLNTDYGLFAVYRFVKNFIG